MKTFVFVGGMPRSGSTLLQNILAQNPRVHASATSGLLEVLFNIRNQWDNVIEHRAMPEAESEQVKLQVLRAVMDGYYAHIDRPLIADKSRGWLAHLEMVEAVLERPVRVLVPVRDLRDILASFETLWRRTAATRQIAQEKEHYLQMQTVGGRCAVWMRDDQPVGMAYNRIHDALARGYRSRLHFVHYEALTAHPAATMAGIYDFLEEEPFDHDFGNVEQVTRENDRVHGLDGLHDIRPAVRPQPSKWRVVLGEAGDIYHPPYPWSSVTPP